MPQRKNPANQEYISYALRFPTLDKNLILEDFSNSLQFGTTLALSQDNKNIGHYETE